MMRALRGPHAGDDVRSASGPARFRVLHFLPDLQIGGGQQVLCRHIAAMDPRLFAHHVVYFLPRHDCADAYREAGATLHDLGPWSGRRWLSTLRRLVALVRNEGIDLLHTNGTPVDKLLGQLVALRCRLPLVTTLHGMRPAWGRPALRPRSLLLHLRVRAAQRLEALLDARALSAVIAVSDAVRDDWRPYLASRGIADERIEVVYSGIPVDAYRASSDGRAGRGIRDELGIPHDAPMVVTVSRLHAGKRNELLVPALAALRERVPGTRLVVVGEGPERERLAEAIRAAGLEGAVHLVGRRLDVAAFLEAADLFVFPSGREGFGLVVVEALAAGLPVVCAPLPSLRRVAEASPALRMVTDDSAPGFAAEMTALLLDPEGSARLGEEGRRFVADHWNVSASARRYEDVYLALLGVSRADAIGSPASTR